MLAPFLLVAAILGLVEGLTEFIPVSSTGHLILAGHLLGFSGDRSEAFEVFIQLGAILAVVWEERRALLETARDALSGNLLAPTSRFRITAVNLSLAFLPAALAGLALHGYIEQHLFTPAMVAVGLVAGAIGILAVEAARPRGGPGGIWEIPWSAALFVGLAQCLSLFPGMSRSACTIMGGMLAGLGRRTATEFSFLLAIPTMFAASLYSLWHWRHVLSAGDAPGFALGFLVSFAAGLATVKFLLRYVATHDFKAFAWYRIALGALVAWILRGHAIR